MEGSRFIGVYAIVKSGQETVPIAGETTVLQWFV